MFEHMDIVESKYEGLVEIYTTKLTRTDTNHAGHSKKTRRRYAYIYTKMFLILFEMIWIGRQWTLLTA